MSPLDPLELAAWKTVYQSAKTSFIRGGTNRIEACDTLRNLRFRGEALSIELNEWTLEKLRVQKAKLADARRKLKDYIDEPGTPTTPSSL